MLEEIAYSLSTWSEFQLIGLACVLVIIGGVIGYYTLPIDLRMSRGLYFVITASLTFLSSLLALVFVFSTEAIIGGYFWFLWAILFGGMACLGLLIVVSSQARSNDAYGERSRAWLAFIPLVNLVLIFKGPDTPRPAQLTGFPKLARNVGYIVGGLLIFGLAGVSQQVVEQTVLSSVENAARSAETEADIMDRLITGTRIEGALQATADESQQYLPSEIDVITVLREITASGTELRRRYDILVSDLTFRPEFGDEIRARICGNSTFASLISQGATIRETYIDPDGTVLLDVRVHQRACDRVS